VTPLLVLLMTAAAARPPDSIASRDRGASPAGELK
jgi:hypothetical protein